MKATRHLLAVAVLAAVAPAAHAEIAIDVIGGSEVSFEGLVQTDGYWYNSDLANLDADGADGDDTDFGLRRAEIVLKGKGPDNLEWVLGYDVSGNGKFLDNNIKYKIGGDSNHYVMVGQYKQFNSMEELSSTKNNDFISKAMITNTFGLSRRLGVAYGYGTSDWSVAASYFGRDLTRFRDPASPSGSGYALRGSWAPINESGNILAFGLSYVNYDTDRDSVRWRARPDADMSNRLVDAGTFVDADRIATVGLEGLWVSGPFKLQGEYMQSETDRMDGASDFKGTGGYLSGVWNVTGETWSYKGGVPGTPGPAEPASGMWQLGLRYDTLDLDDGAVQGGKISTWTAGANWYLRSNFKLMLNYVKVDSERQGIDDNPGIVEARAQFYW